MEKYGYLAMLAFTLFGSIWLEVFLKVGVIRRFKRVLISILPTAAFFLIWDAYAINRGHWFFDKNQILGIFGPFGIPLEEFLFFCENCEIKFEKYSITFNEGIDNGFR